MSRPQLSDLDFGGTARILALPNAIGAQEPATFGQLNAAVEGLAWKDSARVSTASNVNLAAPGATLDGVTMATNDRFVARAQTTASENGIYIWNGASTPATRSLDANTFDELEAATITIEEGTSAGTTFRQTAVNGTLGTTSVSWTTFGTAAAPTSESTAGVARTATQSEVDAGTLDLVIVSPLKLANYAGRKLKLSQTIGDGSSTSFTVTHNFNTRDVHVGVYRNTGNFDEVGVDITRPTVNSVTIATGSTVLAANAARVVVIG